MRLRPLIVAAHVAVVMIVEVETIIAAHVAAVRNEQNEYAQNTIKKLSVFVVLLV
jgi:hypothetical protein